MWSMPAIEPTRDALTRIAILAAAAGLAGCVPRNQPPAPLPPAQPAPVIAAPTEPPPAPAADDWQNGPLSPGDWTYAQGGGGSEARFAEAGGGTLLTLRCGPGGQVRLTRPGAPGGPLVLVTTFGTRALAAADLAPNDPALDEMAFSRGRLLVRAAGGGDLVVPAWAEIGRVVEDCRR